MINPKNTALKIIEQLASNEELIAKLYDGYAETFPATKDFWKSLAGEEMQHASWIRNLGLLTENHKIFIDENRFNTNAIQSYMNYVDKELNRLKKGNIQLI